MMKFNKVFGIAIITILLVMSVDTTIIKVFAAEYENIDSFLVHPANRYDNDLATSDTTLKVEDSLLYYSDIGNSTEQTAYTRQLSKTDFKIEGRIKTPVAIGGNESLFPTDLSFDGDFELYSNLNEGTGTSVNNKHATNPDGITVNTPTWVDSFNPQAGSALDFEADSSQRVDFNDDDDFSFTTAQVDEEFSLSCWFKIESNTGANQYLVGKWELFEREWALYLDPSLQLIFRCMTYDDSPYILVRTDSLDLNTWYFATGTYNANEDETGLIIYINSIDESQFRQENGNYIGMKAHTSKVQIGDGYGGYPFDGIIDEVIVWNQELDAPDIIIIYNYYINNGKIDSRIVIGLEDSSETLNLFTMGLGIEFEILNQSDNNCLIYYSFEGIDDVVYETNFFNVSKNIWLRYKIDVDILRSEFDIEFEYDNGTGIDESEKTNLEISTVFPRLFNSEMLNIVFGSKFTIDGSMRFQMDFWKAPFEEFKFDEWSDLGIDQTAGAKINNVNEFGATLIPKQVGGPEFTIQTFKQVIPDFDSVSGTFSVSTNQSLETDIDETGGFILFGMFNTNPINGSLNYVYSGTVGFNPLRTGAYIATTADPSATLKVGELGDIFNPPFNISRPFDSSTFHNKIELPFTTYLTPNRITIVQINIFGEIYSFEKDTSASHFSNEMIFMVSYVGVTLNFPDPTDQNVTYTMALKDYEPVYRDLFGFLPDLPDLPFPDDPIGATVDATKGVLMQGFRLIGSVMDGVGAVIVTPLVIINTAIAGISSVITIISTLVSNLPTAAATAFGEIIGAVGIAVGLVETAVGLVETAVGLVETAVGLVEDAIIGLPAEIADAIDDFFTSLETAVDTLATSIWTGLVDGISDVLDAVAAGLEVVVTAIMDFLIASVDVIIDLIGAVVSLLWDTFVETPFIGITNLLDLFIVGVQTLFDIGLILVDIVTTYPFMFFVLIAVYLFWGAMAGAEDMVDYCINWITLAFKDTTMGLSLLGFRVPIPLIFYWGFSLIFWAVVDVAL